MNIRHLITHNMINAPGWHTSRRIVVIESDDWGSIRMPSKEVYDGLLSRGVRVDRDPYCRFDCLATADDLSALFDVLLSVRDGNGRPAVLTANAVVANPDFEKIRESGYTRYFYEPFTETLRRSPKHEGAFALWKQGMNDGLFHPQLHGREHLNVSKWLRALRSGDSITRMAFDMGTFGLTSAVDESIRTNYMGAFNSGLDEDSREYGIILTEGQELFRQLFGYGSESFIATTYTWSPAIEAHLVRNGVKYLQGTVCQRIPLDDDTTFRFKKTNFAGRRSESGMTYLMRNCYFEPSQNPDTLGDCLKRIQIAFKWRKPATISMHRLNVIGAVDEHNRAEGLKMLKQLLQTIVKWYPDVEFMTSDELGRLMDVK